MSKAKAHTKHGWADLADGLQVARRTVYSWRQLPDAPRGAGLAAWRAFVAKRNLGVAPNRMTEARTALLREKTTREIKLLGLRISKEEGTNMPVEETADLLRFLSTFTKATLRPLGAVLGARCAGKTAEELNVLGPTIGDEFCGRLSEAITAWDASRAAPSPAGETNHHLTTRG